MRIASFFFLSIFVLSSAPALAQVHGPASPDEARPAVAPVLGATTTSLACYFVDGSGNSTWQWGLDVGNGWYSFTGAWQTTPYTKLQKFFTNVSAGILNDACNRSRSYYYPKGGFSLVAFFAADKGAGYNYPIVACGVELFPQY